MNLTGRITGMITNPAETIKDISEHPYLEEAVLIVGITAILSAISAYLMQSKIIYDFSDMDVSGLETIQLITTIMPVVIALIGVLILWVIAAGIVHLVSVALGGEGQFIQMLVVYGYAHIPIMISAVIGIVLMNFIEPTIITMSSTGAVQGDMGGFSSNPIYQALLVSGTLLKLWTIGLV
ncbi:MAG: YIP1 family protein, partial [Methanosarcinales archaeon]|nr:YIP1 family protein [Methanosarcinales archaeon]